MYRVNILDIFSGRHRLAEVFLRIVINVPRIELSIKNETGDMILSFKFRTSSRIKVVVSSRLNATSSLRSFPLNGGSILRLQLRLENNVLDDLASRIPWV